MTRCLARLFNCPIHGGPPLKAEDYDAMLEICSRLELEPKDAAARLRRGAVQALAPEPDIRWPIYLVQAGRQAPG